MLEVLADFVEELRLAGLPVALSEAVDAAEAVRAVPLDRRDVVKSALGATLVKSSEHWDAYSTTFDVFFGRRALPAQVGDGAPPGEPLPAGRDGPGAEPDREGVDLRELAAQSLRAGDASARRLVARLAVARLAGVEPGRPVGVSYYLYRTVRALGLDELVAGLLAEAAGPGSDPLEARVRADELAARAAELRSLVEAEIRAALVAERGAAAVARNVRRALPEDVEFMHASGEELERIREALRPLARSLAVRLARRRRHHRGALDFRSTIRRSLSTGGVPVEPRFHATRPAKPEIVVLADVSGSVASFARFTLHLVYAIASQFSKVRSFVFVDGIDEVTRIFDRSATIEEAVRRVASEADVVHLDGHSDYGNAFGLFAERYARTLTTRSHVIVLGDARNNYHAANAEALAAVARRARHVYWLNPEPASYWGSGDSIVEQYAPLVDGVFECRNLRQLERFIDLLD